VELNKELLHLHLLVYVPLVLKKDFLMLTRHRELLLDLLGNGE
jgi:hypothetical protein